MLQMNQISRPASINVFEDHTYYGGYPFDDMLNIYHIIKGYLRECMSYKLKNTGENKKLLCYSLLSSIALQQVIELQLLVSLYRRVTIEKKFRFLERVPLIFASKNMVSSNCYQLKHITSIGPFTHKQT